MPNLEAPESPKVGVWGEHRRKYLRVHQHALYTAMMLSDTLNAHLEKVDRTATEMYDCLTAQLAAQEGITELLKATNQMGTADEQYPQSGCRDCEKGTDLCMKQPMKVYRKYQQREYERMRHPDQFPPDYFFSALAELILGD